MKRPLIAAIALALVVAGTVAPAGARDRHCTARVHHPLGTDEVTAPLPLPDDVPTDVGFVKVYINCSHGR